ncbi:MAG: hypothetical protein Q9219_006390 [cf. Caloplaca sp. 3 TL-2023]
MINSHIGSLHRTLISSTSATRRALSSTVNLSSRPSIAPKPSLDIKHIRENPDLYSQNCIDRNYFQQKDYPQAIRSLSEERRKLQADARSIRIRNNVIHTKLSLSKSSSAIEPVEASTEQLTEADLLQEAKQLKVEIEKSANQEETLTKRIESLAINLPNLTSKETPVGTEPRVIGYIATDRKPTLSSVDLTWRDHVHIGQDFDLLDFASAGKTTGWGWYYLKNQAALLEQALIQYAISVALKHGFSAVSPPSIVYTHIANACGFHPRDQGGEQQTYAIEQKEGDPLSTPGTVANPGKTLAGTAEIPFAGMKANTIMHERELPIQIVGASRCYRAEAGARGAESRGLYRVHEFTKVEMFAWTIKNEEQTAFDAMLAIQKEILGNLHIPCRILEMPTSDLGASATRKVDIEAFFPSRRNNNDGWGEITSVSICTDYQTRRLNTRAKSMSSNGLEFPSTVNGTALAVPRVLAALLENGRNEADSQHPNRINTPNVLHPWMHGIKFIEKPPTSIL